MSKWRRSSYSGGGGDGGQDCVETANLNGLVGVRDSKAPDAAHLTLKHSPRQHVEQNLDRRATST